MNIALIKNKTVFNVGVFDNMETAVQMIPALGIDEVADIGKFFVQIGDAYENGVFYRGGKELQPIPDEIDILTEQLSAVTASIPPLITQSVMMASDDRGKGREIAASVASIPAALPVKEWSVGMVTNPGDIVWDKEHKFKYVYTGKDIKTHTDLTYFPGANGVYYWSIIPATFEGYKVFPNVTGIIVAAAQNEVWWNNAMTQKYRWTAASNNNVNQTWYPGAAGVHQWAAV